jgi:hypothetical protein
MKPECRKARKAMSQKQWLARYPHYFSEPKHAERVRRWRRARRDDDKHSQAPDGKTRGQSGLAKSASSTASGKLTTAASLAVIQDCCALIQDSIMRNPLIIGLIAHIFDCALQDNMAVLCRALVAKGNAFLRTNQIPPLDRGKGGR